MKPSYYAIYVVRRNGGLYWAGGRKFKPSASSVTISKQTFTVDISRPMFVNRKGRSIYLFEHGVGQVLTTPNNAALSPKYVKAIFGQEIVAQLVSGLGHKAGQWDNIIWAVMGALAGVGLGWILCGQFGF